MRAKVLESIAPYWNYGVHSLKEGDEVNGELAAYLVSTHSPVEPLDDEARALREPLQEEPEEPPAELDIDANTADVLAWVGDDPERAAEALEAERAKEKPRSTLVKQLEKLVGAEPAE